MGFNNNNDGVPTSATQFIKAVLGVAPVGFAGAAAYSRIKSNSLSYVERMTTNSYGDMTATVGDSLRRYHYSRQKGREAQVQEFVKQLTTTSETTKILKSNAADKNALIAAAIETLDLIDDERALAAKQTLLDALGDEVLNEEQLDNVSREIEGLLERATNVEKEEFSKSFERYGQVKNQLQAPRLQLQGVQSRVEVVSGSSGLSRTGQRLFNMVKNEVGGSTALKLLKFEEPTGGVSYYALVGEKNKAFTIPLQLSNQVGVPVLRTGKDLVTPFTINPLFADAKTLYNRVLDFDRIGEDAGYELAYGEKHPIKEFPSFAVDEFRKRAHAAGGAERISGRDFEQWQRTFGQPLPGPLEVGDYLDTGGPTTSQLYGLKLREAVKQRHAYITVLGVEDLDGPDLPAAIAARSGTPSSFFDPRKPEIHRMESGQAFMNIGLGQAHGYRGPLSMMRPTGINTRQTLPITARSRQSFGRTTQFVPGSPNKLGKTFLTVGSPIEFDVTAGPYASSVSRPVLLDVYNEEIFNAWAETSKYGFDYDRPKNPLTLEEGQVFIDEALTIEEQFSRTIYDPYKEGKLTSSKLLNALLSQGELEITDPAELSRFFAETQGYLGMNAAGVVKLPNYSGSVALRAKAERRASGHIVISGTVQYTPQEPKIFSGAVKATARRYGTKNGPRKILERVGAEGLLEGVDRPIIGTGSMIGKAPMHAAQQMISGLGMIVDFTHPAQLFRTISDAVDPNDVDNYLKNVMVAVVENTPHTVDPEKLGGVLAAAFYSKSGVGPQDIELALQNRGFSEDFIKRTMQSAAKGITFGATTITPGPDGTLWKAAQGSMEPRVYQFLQHNLLTAGVSKKDTQEIMLDVMLRKSTSPQEVAALSGMTKMVSSMRGPKGVLDVRIQSLTRVSVDEFIEAAQRGSSSFSEWLGQMPDEGFVLDASSSKRSVAATFRKVFRSDEIVISSGSSVRAMKGVVVRQGSGEVATTTALLPKYTSKLAQLAGTLERLDQVGVGTVSEQRSAQEALTAWKGDFMDLWGSAYDSLLRGNLRGSGFVQASGLSVFSEWGDISLSADQNARARKLLSKNKGASVFIDTQGFLDSLRSFMSGASDTYSAAGLDGEKAATDDLADILRRYFYTNEPVTAVASRHPVLGAAHVAPVSVYRPLPEADLGTKDVWFRRLINTEEGQEVLTEIDPLTIKYRDARKVYKQKLKQWQVRIDEHRRLAAAAEETFLKVINDENIGEKQKSALRKQMVETRRRRDATNRLRPQWEDFNPDPENRRLRSFAGLAEKTESEVNKFFAAMAQVLHKVAPLEGGGRIFLTPQDVEVNVDGSTRKFEVSIASAMLADRDGDMIQIFHPLSGAREKISKYALGNSPAATDMALLRIETGLIFDELNRGVAAFGKSQGGASTNPLIQLQDAILKEFAVKSLGPVDVSLKPLIYGIQNSIDPSDPSAVRLANRAVAMIVALEEGTLKSKKLNKFVDLGGMVQRSLQLLYADETTDISGFRKLIESTLFKDSALLGEGVTLTGVSGPDIDPVLAQRLEGHQVSLGDDVFDLLRRAAIWVKGNSAQNVQTAKQLSALAASSGTGFDEVLGLGTSTQAGMLGADFEMKSYSKIIKGLKSIEGIGGKLIGPLTLGAVAGVALTAVADIFFDDASGSLDIPGQLASSYRIQPSPQLTPDQLSHEQIGNQNILPAGTTYQDRSSSYRIQGKVRSESSGYSLGGLMNRIGIPTTMLINDRRMPVTSSYVEQRLAD